MINLPIFSCFLIGTIDASNSFSISDNQSNLSLVFDSSSNNKTVASLSDSLKEISLDPKLPLQSNMKIMDDGMKKPRLMQFKSPSLKFKSKFSPERIPEFNLIFKTLSGTITETIVERIIEYNYDDPVQDVYEIVTNKLELSQKEKENLDFYNDDFLEKLDFIIKTRATFPLLDLFWYDLEKLLFKLILYLKQKMINATDDRLAEASKNIQSILSIALKNSCSNTLPEFNLKTMKISDFNYPLLKSEIFEHFKSLSYRFADALEYFYSPLFAKEVKGKEEMNLDEITCEKFKTKFFENGDPDTDLLFKYFLIDHSFKEIKKCLEFNIQPDYSKINTELMKLKIKNKINQSKLANILHFLTDHDLKYSSNLIMKFISSNGKKVLVASEYDLYEFLQRMRDAELFEKEKIKAIVEFMNEDHYEWNLLHYEYYLRRFGKKINGNDPTIKERDFINKCLGLFDLRPLD